MTENDDRQVAEPASAAKASQARGELEPRSSILEDATGRRRSRLARRVDEHQCRDLGTETTRVEQRVETAGRVADEDERPFEMCRADERMLVLDVLLEASAETSPHVTSTDTRSIERAEADVPHPLPNTGP